MGGDCQNSKFRKWWKKIWKYKTVILAFAWVISFLLGTGAVWQWFNLQFEKQRNELDIIRVSIELRDNIESKLIKLFDIGIEYLKEEDIPKKSRLKIQFDLVKDDLKTFENRLAKVENREPRRTFDIPLPEVPKKPTGIGIEGSWEGK